MINVKNEIWSLVYTSVFGQVENQVNSEIYALVYTKSIDSVVRLTRDHIWNQYKSYHD